MYGRIDFDIDEVDRIGWVYEQYEPEEEEYDTEEERQQLINEYSTFEVECFDGEFGKHMGWISDMSFEDIEENFGEQTLRELQMELQRGKTKGYIDNIISSKYNSIDINNVNQVNDVAKKYFETVPEYYKDTRGYILTDGEILLFGDAIDHLEINRIDNMTISKFVSLGNIRIGNQSIYIEKEPTYPQIQQLRKMLAAYSNETIYIDIVKSNGSNNSYSDVLFSLQYSYYNPQIVLNQLLRYFREGIKPDDAIIREGKKNRLNKKEIRKIISETLYRYVKNKKIF